MKKIIISTDGACKGNPGIGGWGAVISYENNFIKICGGENNTTNNKMELTAAIKALEYVSQLQQNDIIRVDFITDSNYLKDGITKWKYNWEKNGWKTASGASVKNKELWIRIIQLSSSININWIWQKSHIGHELNELADQLANEGIKKIME